MTEGQLLAMFIAPDKQAPMEERAEVRAIAGLGLEGDRYLLGRGTFSPKRDKIRDRSVGGAGPRRSLPSETAPNATKPAHPGRASADAHRHDFLDRWGATSWARTRHTVHVAREEHGRRFARGIDGSRRRARRSGRRRPSSQGRADPLRVRTPPRPLAERSPSGEGLSLG